MKTRRACWFVLIVLALVAQPLAMSGSPGSVSAQDAEVAAEGTPSSTEESTEGQSEGENGATDEETSDGTPEPAESDGETPDETSDAAEGTPVAEPSEEPETETPDPAASPEAEPVGFAAIDEIVVTLYCDRDPELTRIDNTSADPIEIISIGSQFDQSVDEPYAVGQTIASGSTRIFRSGPGATYGTILTTSFLYTDDAYDQDGAVIETDAGTITESCPPAPPADVNDLKITLSCWSNPELTRIDNLGDAQITILSIGSLFDQGGDEPFALNRPLGGGSTVIYRSGPGATYGTVLTTSYIYTDFAFQQEGVEIVTDAGTTTARCPARPPSEMTLSINCAGSPETTTIRNVGNGPIRLSQLSTTWDRNGNEPYNLNNRALYPGQSITYQSGPGASSNVLTNQQIYTEAAGTAERVNVRLDTGKVFTKSCPPGRKWIEVNLSTQYLIAWEGYTRVRETYVSTGRPGFDTPTGTFYVNTKLYSQTMSGCLQGECYYVPDVPFVMYFTNVGHAIHGAYWHNNFGNVMSHGCINLPVWFSEWLYYWTSYSTPIVIHY
ncbi:MAG: L,D-transpeptidase family protein [Thermomicrobiales bacterium]